MGYLVSSADEGRAAEDVQSLWELFIGVVGLGAAFSSTAGDAAITSVSS